MNGWPVLILAGSVEIVWIQSIRPTEQFTRLRPTILCFVLGVTSVYLLSRAMHTLPVGTAYAVFTGIGAVGAIWLGILVHNDPASVSRFAALSLIVAGLVLARLTEGA